MIPCPHCHAVARIEPSAALRWRCGVCGGPVVPAEGLATRSHAELASLVGAQRLRAMAVGWTAAAIVLGGIAVMGLSLALLLWRASHAAGDVLGVLTAAGALLSFVARRRARSCNAEAQIKLHEAWERVAAEVLQARGRELTAPELAHTLHTDETYAERLLVEREASP